MGRLLLVRHGESQWNAAGIVQGQDGPGLTERGHDQARRVGAWLAEEAPDAVLAVSDLVRCRETAAPYETAAAEVQVDARLRERHFGAWQGADHATLAAEHPALWERFRSREDVLEEVGGESTPTLVARVREALVELASANPVTVVVTHGGPVWHGTHALVGVPEPTLGPVSNAGVTILDVHEHGAAQLLTWNQVGHLPPPLRTTWPAAHTA